MVEILDEALRLKNYPLAPFPTKLSLTGPTRLSVTKLGLEQVKAEEGIAEVQAEALRLKNTPLGLFPM